MSTKRYSALALMPHARETIMTLCSQSDFSDNDYEKLVGELDIAEKRFGALSLLGQSLSSYQAPERDSEAWQQAKAEWAHLTARVLHRGNWGQDSEASELLTERDVELLGTNIKELEEWMQECARDDSQPRRHLTRTSVYALPADHRFSRETFITQVLLRYAKECLTESHNGPLTGSIDWKALEVRTKELAVGLKYRLSSPKYLYSALTVLPESLNNLRVAASDEQSQMQAERSGRNPVKEKIETAMHRYEGLMVVHLAQLWEERHAITNSEGPTNPALDTSADKREAMICRAATVSAWHKDSEASYVFTLGDLQFLRDTLTATHRFLQLCLMQDQTPGSIAAKGHWAKAVETHGVWRSRVEAAPIQGDKLMADAWDAVAELQRWSEGMQAANNTAQESMQRKKDEVHAYLERMSWPLGESSSASPIRPSMREWLVPSGNSPSVSPSRQLRSRITNSRSRYRSQAVDDDEEDAIPSSDVPKIVVSSGLDAYI